MVILTKRILSVLFSVAIALQVLAGSAAATTFYVDDDGPGNYTTIQSAVDEAVSGDTIIVKPGTYPETVNMSVSRLTFKGEGYPEVYGFNNYGTPDIGNEFETIQGFTITKDGILMDGRDSLGNVISNNRFQNCGVSLSAMEYGGFSSSEYPGDVITHNVFHGGGISLSYGGDGSQKIIGNEIYDADYGIIISSGAGAENHIGEISGNKIKGCNIGLYMAPYTLVNKVYNNEFNNDVNVRLIGNEVGQWNTSAPLKGTNIIGGPYIGGNYWATPAGDGFSQTHKDNNGDGIAEEAYNIKFWIPDENGNNAVEVTSDIVVDYFPLVTPRTEPAPTPKPTPTPEPTPTPTPTPGPTPEPTPTPTPDPVDDGGSSGGSHHSSGGGSGGGGGGSPEPAKNIEVKDTTKVFIPNEQQVFFNFTNDVTVVNYIVFESTKTMGKTTAVVENLKNKSTLVKDLPEGVVYKSFNVWVGNAGYGSSDKIMDASLSFKVEKSWIEEENVDPASIALYRYVDDTWVQLPVEQSGEDGENLYFVAETPGYGSFVIAGAPTLQAQEEANLSAENRTVGSVAVEGNETNEPDTSKTKNTLISIGVVAGAFLVGGFVLKSMKK